MGAIPAELKLAHIPRGCRPRCGAKTRYGKPCQAQALTTGFCAVHSGIIPGGPSTPEAKERQADRARRCDGGSLDWAMTMNTGRTPKQATPSLPKAGKKPKPKQAAKTAKPTRTKAAIKAANGPANSYLYTKEIGDEICQRIAEGESLRSICKSNRMPSCATVLNWTQDKEHAFAEQFARAREIGYFILADEIMEIADDATNDYTTRAKEEGAEVVVNHDHISRSKLRVDTRKWMLSKMLPKVYGDKLAVGGDADAPPIQHQHHAVRWMTEEEAKARGWA